MKQNQSRIFLYIGITLGLIILGVVVTSIISSTNNTTNISARASSSNALEFSGVVAGIDVQKGVIVVDNLMFVSNANQNLGRWIITPPANFNLEFAAPGQSITIGGDPKTFNITEHTLTALRISR